MALIHFLLLYDLEAQKLISHEEFRDGDEAAQAYARLEAEYRGRSDVEIVLVGADSIDTIRLTHGQYFEEGEPTAATPFLMPA
ncbi:MAG TPA: hypothetical protein VGG41_00635 [Solirubrobacteraceae bacterium]|jgi:hypothetical protein